MTEVLLAGRRRRRFHTKSFKAMIVESCYVEGISLSSVAIDHGLNPNMVRRWVTEFESGVGDLPIPNKERLRALIAAGNGHTERVPASWSSPMTDHPKAIEPKADPVGEQANASSAAPDVNDIGDFLPIKVQPSSSAPCRVEIQIRKMDTSHCLHIALASAMLADCAIVIREFLQ